MAHFDPFRFASPLSLPCHSHAAQAARHRQSKLREYRLAIAPRNCRNQQGQLGSLSQRASQFFARQSSSSRLVEFQTVLHAVWICSWRVAPSSRANSQSNKSSMISDSTLARKFATSSSILTTKEKSRRELLSQKPPFCSSCWQLLCTPYCLGCRITV